MKYRVLIHADSLIRDPAYMLVLAEVLRAHGVEPLVSSRITTGFYLRTWKPHVLVHSQAHTLRGYYDHGLIDKRRGPAVIFIPQEGNNSGHSTLRRGFRGVLDEPAAQVIRRVFHFNDWHVDWFAKNSSFRRDQLIHLGNPRLDIAKFGGFGEPRSKTGVIGFVGRFPTINKYDGTSAFYHLLEDHTGHPAEWHDQTIGLVSRQIGVAHWYGQFIHWLMRETDLKVSLRPHHEERRNSDGYRRLKDRYGERIQIDHGMSIFHWARSVDAIISTTSLTSIESYLAGTPFLCVDKLALAEKSVLADNDEASLLKIMDERFVPHGLEDFGEKIRNVCAGSLPVGVNSGMEAYLKEHFSWPYTGSLIARIADGILETLECSPRQPAIPALPKFAGDLFYLLRTAQFGGRRPWIVTDKNYSPFFHPAPEFVDTIARRILAECPRT